MTGEPFAEGTAAIEGVPLEQGDPLYGPEFGCTRDVRLHQGVPLWRDSMRPVRFYLFDAQLLILLVILWLFVPTWWTTAAVVLALGALRVAEARGYRLRAALRAVRARVGRAGVPALHARRVRGASSTFG